MNTIKLLARCMAMAAVAGAISNPTVHAFAQSQRAADTQTEVDGPNLLVNGGFERGADPGQTLILQPGTPLLTGWTVETPGTERQVYYVGSFWQAAEGTRSLGFRLSQYQFTVKQQTPAIKQTFATTAGQRYRVTFYQAVDAGHKHVPMLLRAMVAGQTREYTFQADQAATRQQMEWVKRTFLFTATAASTTIAFAPHLTPFDDGPLLGLDNVQVRALQSPPAGSVAGTALTLAAPSLAAGGKQTVTVTTGNGAAVALVIDYPDGSQQLVPAHADATGHYSYTWTVSAAEHGTVKIIVVDGMGTIARGTFTVS